MALGTLTKVDGWVEGNKRVRVYDVQLTSGANYTTGGETVLATAVGLAAITHARPSNLAITASGTTSRSVAVQYQTGSASIKLLVHTTASAEAAGNSDQSTFTARVEFVGW